MFRTIIALLIALVAAILIGAFQVLGLTLEQIQTILGSANVTDALKYQGSLLFASLMTPYSMALNNVYSPLVALGVAGFISGLVSKSPVRMLFVSVIAIAIFFAAYVVLSMGAALEVDVLMSVAKNIAVDLGAAFGLLFIPGIIGARLTQEEDAY